MSQFNLTHEEDQTVLDALRSKGAAYTAMFGSTETSIEALIAKVESQLPVPVIEQPENEPTAEEVEAHFAAEEKPAKAKKAK